MVNGFLNVNKPIGMTSHDVVAQVRRLYKRDTGSKKVGHAGTLDPLASGVLVVCLGSATRLSEYVMHSTKRYVASVTFGITTDTYDAEGKVVQETSAEHLTIEQLQEILPRYTGKIKQIPPMYSAIKKDGKKLYDIARAGETIELEPRDVTIHQIAISRFEPPLVELDVICEAGTYIRSLAFDLGRDLTVGAHLSGLVRVASGQFTVEQAVNLEALNDDAEWLHQIIPPHIALSNFPSVELDEDAIQTLQYGRALPWTKPIVGDLVMGYSKAHALVAVLENVDNWLKPHKVFLNDTHL